MTNKAVFPKYTLIDEANEIYTWRLVFIEDDVDGYKETYVDNMSSEEDAWDMADMVNDYYGVTNRQEVLDLITRTGNTT